MTQPNEQLIEEIQRALKQSELLPSYQDHVKNNADRWLRALLEERRFYKEDRDRCERLERKAYEQLQQTREELEHAKKMYDQVYDSRSQVESELKQVKESRDKWEQGYNRKTLRCVEAEAEVESLHTELAAKDKVLEWYGDAKNYAYQFYYGEDENDPDEIEELIMADDGERAREVLSPYPPREKGADK